MADNEGKRRGAVALGSWLAIGAGVGAALGAATGSMATGLTLGVSIGLIIGLLWMKLSAGKPDEPDPPPVEASLTPPEIDEPRQTSEPQQAVDPPEE